MTVYTTDDVHRWLFVDDDIPLCRGGRLLPECQAQPDVPGEHWDPLITPGWSCVCGFPPGTHGPIQAKEPAP